MIDTFSSDMASIAMKSAGAPMRSPVRSGAAMPTAKEAANGFESVFLNLMLEPMEKAGGSFFGEGAAGRIFGGMFRQEIAKTIATTRPLGIARQVEKALHSQEEARRALEMMNP